MSYTKHTWQDNEIITDIKMNNIENGLDAVSEKSDDLYDFIHGDELEDGLATIVNELSTTVSGLSSDVSDLQSAKIFTPVPKLIDGIDITGVEVLMEIHLEAQSSIVTQVPCIYYNSDLTINDLLTYDYVQFNSCYSKPLVILPISCYAVADPEPGEFYLNTNINGIMVTGIMNPLNTSITTVMGLPANADIRLAESGGGDTNEDDGGDDSGGGNGMIT